MLINDTAFLCGYFSVKSSVQTGLFASQENFWTRVTAMCMTGISKSPLGMGLLIR